MWFLSMVLLILLAEVLFVQKTIMISCVAAFFEEVVEVVILVPYCGTDRRIICAKDRRAVGGSAEGCVLRRNRAACWRADRRQDFSKSCGFKIIFFLCLGVSTRRESVSRESGG